MKKLLPGCRSFLHMAAVFGVFCIIGVAATWRHEKLRGAEEQGEYFGVTEGMYGSKDAGSMNGSGNPETGGVSALEDFGAYLEELCVEGRMGELDGRVISKRLSLEEAALLAEGSPLLEHLEWYAEGAGTPCGIRRVLSADVNGDGMEDVVEYEETTGMSGLRNGSMLNIYLGARDGSFALSCAMPLFEAGYQATDAIEVVGYKGETYLLMREREISITRPPSRITAYQISRGIPEGKLELDWSCSGIGVTVEGDADAYGASFLEKDRMELYHAVNRHHCSADTSGWQDGWWNLCICGSGETETWETEDKAAVAELRKSYEEKYAAEQRPYQEKYGEEYQTRVWYVSYTHECDLNNDGIMEKYAKSNRRLCLYEDPAICFSRYGVYDTREPFMTGEYYGVHEGRNGLTYYMESGGDETDFLKMCGLDIWEGEMTPQHFWVEETDRGNITYIAYQDGEEYRQLIEGYLIQGSEYEKAVTAEYVPEIECSAAYEAVDGQRGVNYIVRGSKDGPGFELHWDNGGEREESLNRNVRELVEKKMGEMDLSEADLQEDGEWDMWCAPAEATEEKFIADCMISYSYYVPWAVKPYGDSVKFRICINLLTGECTEIEE